jgi:hypothetical protein
LYESAPKAQRDIIDGMIVAALRDDNPNMDLNIVAKLSKLADKDLIKLAEESKLLQATPV